MRARQARLVRSFHLIRGVIRSQLMMDMMSGGMMIGMGLIWLLVLVFLVLGIAAAIKYLRS